MSLSLAGLTAEAIALIVQILQTVGLPGLFALMMVESFGIPPLPSEVILAFSGFLIAQGTDPSFTWPSVVVVSLAGSLAGAFLAYEVGRQLGLPWVRRIGAPFGVTDHDLDRVQDYFDRRGPATVFFLRMVPLARAYVSYPAGAAEMTRGRFAFFTVAGAFPFTVVLVYAGVVLGERYTIIEQYFDAIDAVLIAAVLLLLGYLYWKARERKAERSRTAAPEAAPPSGPDPPATP